MICSLPSAFLVASPSQADPTLVRFQNQCLSSQTYGLGGGRKRASHDVVFLFPMAGHFRCRNVEPGVAMICESSLPLPLSPFFSLHALQAFSLGLLHKHKSLCLQHGQVIFSTH
jgi:hypothetical protein